MDYGARLMRVARVEYSLVSYRRKTFAEEPVMSASRPEISPLMRELSAHIAGAIKVPLPAEVAIRAKVHLVDTVAAMIAGSRLVPGKKAIAYIKTP